MGCSSSLPTGIYRTRLVRWSLRAGIYDLTNTAQIMPGQCDCIQSRSFPRASMQERQNSFSGGSKSVAAVRAFLRYAQAHWLTQSDSSKSYSSTSCEAVRLGFVSGDPLDAQWNTIMTAHQ